ncbi:hypothetical protein PACTADRAFT_51883 [Pachysolen tannophilus NRRL Y-2460]|uniref:Serine hydrolase domain-containing protein n=1 Tax=Pachysolen tannophilus NRRL Y-2460 TaxID=669874 RepID=A0A1E4TNC8_PACTA|nr:hypothetical protein PACTADRAFT_51883 [Pachysolen tannophilus NRRL Y-2460]
MSNGKILCLHGFVQTADIFKAKISGVRKALKKQGFECIFLTAPIKLLPADLPFDVDVKRFDSKSGDDQQEYRAWWLKKDAFNVDVAIESIKDFTKEHGPFVGILAFSQGAGLAGLITSQFKDITNNLQQKDLKFSIFYSGFKINGCDPEVLKYYEQKINIPTLHVIGELDTVVDLDMSMRLYEECCEPGTATLLKHPGGHFVPNSRNVVDKVVAWVVNAVKENDNNNNKNNKDSQEQEEKDKELDDDLMAMIDKLGTA